MLKTEWLSTINSDFYAYSETPKSNTTTTEYTSGRNISFKANSKCTMLVSCKIMLTVDTELPLFWAWFNDVLGQTCNAFRCADKLGDRYFRFVSVPTAEDTDRVYRVLSLNLEEVA